MTFSFEVNIAQPAEIVYDTLADMDQFVQHHPLIYAARAVSPGYYKIYERVMIGFIPYRFTYFAQIIADPAAQQITMKADLYRLLKLEIIFSLSSQESYTRVREDIIINGPVFMARYLKKVLTAAHLDMFEKIGNKKF